jgi:hypothetical protein
MIEASGEALGCGVGLLGGPAAGFRSTGPIAASSSATRHAVPLIGGSVYTFIDYAFGATNIELYLMNEKQILAQRCVSTSGR